VEEVEEAPAKNDGANRFPVQERKLPTPNIAVWTTTNFPLVETGEEGEKTLFTCRAKLYSFVVDGNEKGWKERGVGHLKLNVTIAEPKKGRFVLRADKTQRLLLNTAVLKQQKYGDPAGLKNNMITFLVPTEDGKGMEQRLLKVSPRDLAFPNRNLTSSNSRSPHKSFITASSIFRRSCKGRKMHYWIQRCG